MAKQSTEIPADLTPKTREEIETRLRREFDEFMAALYTPQALKGLAENYKQELWKMFVAGIGVGYAEIMDRPTNPNLELLSKVLHDYNDAANGV